MMQKQRFYAYVQKIANDTPFMIKTLREERARLMKRLIHSEDVSVKPRIRELTAEILNQLRQGGRFSAANPATIQEVINEQTR